MSATPATTAPEKRVLRAFLRGLWNVLGLPILVAIGVVFIAVGLIEGQAIGDFLYAIF